MQGSLFGLLFLDTRQLPLDTSCMPRKIRDLCAVLLVMSIYSLPKLLMAQTNETDAETALY